MSRRMIAPFIKPVIKSIAIAGLVVGTAACGGVELPGLGGEGAGRIYDGVKEKCRNCTTKKSAEQL